MKYRMRSTVFGARLYYQCPRCYEHLKSPLRDAGKKDSCPACQQEFVVPGEDAKEMHAQRKLASKIRHRRRTQVRQEPTTRPKRGVKVARPSYFVLDLLAAVLYLVGGLTVLVGVVGGALGLVVDSDTTLSDTGITVAIMFWGGIGAGGIVTAGLGQVAAAFRDMAINSFVLIDIAREMKRAQAITGAHQ